MRPPVRADGREPEQLGLVEGAGPPPTGSAPPGLSGHRARSPDRWRHGAPPRRRLDASSGESSRPRRTAPASVVSIPAGRPGRGCCARASSAQRSEEASVQPPNLTPTLPGTSRSVRPANRTPRSRRWPRQRRPCGRPHRRSPTDRPPRRTGQRGHCPALPATERRPPDDRRSAPPRPVRERRAAHRTWSTAPATQAAAVASATTATDGDRPSAHREGRRPISEGREAVRGRQRGHERGDPLATSMAAPSAVRSEPSRSGSG
jgi:hypothetical protein